MATVPPGNPNHPPDANVPIDAIRAFIEARDGTCRRADCTVPAKHAQRDHHVETGEGADTCTDNLIAVCHYHHNVKTDRRWDYILEPATGTGYWLFEDGIWEAIKRNFVPLPDSEEISFDD
ncbi:MULTISPECIES: HNH endonuclease signature motif containing protein [Corynebacterium]|uniref:HNH endonuclease n=1 Tax=Corynebacterium phoceense TaxID=1686286 RepID=A0A540R825_9CORY|nr:MULTISPECIES: HNH endonuclease signature motif containing protein [Corynebacterium]KXB52477.1 hypothetical protein HMPREF0307_02228 [Corynebacterium sp. DNF00584]MBF9011439.1 HNH endonuclease [Corynebacterium phoceense]OFL79390.1 hypothetical protein HMPREF2748_10300 [Corynebacterium sp. HMSC077B05]OFN43212.1 hypothetical protein HMPREF2559_10710 [Corynebacterium sp. HMSC072G08]OFP18453.1 hypothetical protein HMPREF2998_12220 [Corynebacterium sp. HMSC065A05]